ncbi:MULTISPECIES: hypothetical protein [Pectobacterium]|uniref:hypothetical protein n=1 Tax=Pectobacterium TaxID=122277 RepID=UPI000582D562|nr:hypothetical protein [Pectobacterium brasiliense]KHS80484.1 hypothetical protein RC81_08090 [Pectobacterium brasiliense]
MSIQAMSFVQVAKTVGLSREQLYVTLRATDLIKSIGFVRVYQRRRGAIQSYTSERFEGQFIINSAGGKRDDNDCVVPDQMLDCRVIPELKRFLNKRIESCE